MRTSIAALVCSFALAGCGAGLALHVTVPRPAEIPARSFPVVALAASDDDESRAAMEALAVHLAGGQTRVVRSSPERLLVDAIAAGSPALALLVSLHVGETLRTEMSAIPALQCPTLPCYGYAQRMPIDVRVQTGELVVRVLDPRSAAELSRARLVEEESEPSPLAARLAVIDRLVARATALVDVSEVTMDLELDDVSDPIARAALDAARAGQAHEARLALAARVGAAEIEPEDRAHIAFDLAQVRRIDVDPHAASPVDEERARLAEAEQLLLDAILLAPTERHARALAQLRAERLAREDVRAQAAATDTNFGSRRPPPRP
ncbi:MAG: hypothetical protein U0234_03895 [Sandaracinus sp.]